MNSTKLLSSVFLSLSMVAGGYYFFFVRGPGKARVYPAQGIVLFQGKPAVGARVTLFPEDKSSSRFCPIGIVEEDGTFKLTTYKLNDGAPAGRYRVSVVRGRLDGEEIAKLKKVHAPKELEQILAEKAADPLYSKYANSDLTVEIPVLTKQLRFELD